MLIVRCVLHGSDGGTLKYGQCQCNAVTDWEVASRCHTCDSRPTAWQRGSSQSHSKRLVCHLTFFEIKGKN